MANTLYEVTIYDGHANAGDGTIEAANLAEAIDKAVTWAQKGDWDHAGEVEVSISQGGEELERASVAVGTNGYVVYPNSISQMDLGAALDLARESSIEHGTARVEDCDTGKVVAKFKNGEQE